MVASWWSSVICFRPKTGCMIGTCFRNSSKNSPSNRAWAPSKHGSNRSDSVTYYIVSIGILLVKSIRWEPDTSPLHPQSSLLEQRCKHTAARKPRPHEKQASTGGFPSMNKSSTTGTTRPRSYYSPLFRPRRNHRPARGPRPNLSDLGYLDGQAFGHDYWAVTHTRGFRPCMYHTVAGGHTPSSSLRRRHIPSWSTRWILR